VITLDEWAEIRRLHRAEGLGIKAVARKLGVSKNTVRRALRSEEVPRYQRAPKGSIVDAAEPAIREQLALCATMPAAVIAERIGWQRSITVLRERVAELRPLYQPQDPSGRTEYEPGQRVQDDFWFPPVELPLGHGAVATGTDVPPVLVMASGYSRWMLGLMIPSRHAEDLVPGTWQLLAATRRRPEAAGVGQRGRGREVPRPRPAAGAVTAVRRVPGPAGLPGGGAAAAGAVAQTSGCILHLFGLMRSVLLLCWWRR